MEFQCRNCKRSFVIVISPPSYPDGSPGHYEARAIEAGAYMADNSAPAYMVSKSTVYRLRRAHESYC